MKLTKARLKRIIKEELQAIKHRRSVPTGNLDVSDQDRLNYEEDPINYAMPGTPGGGAHADDHPRAPDQFGYAPSVRDPDLEKYKKDKVAYDKGRRQSFAKQFKEGETRRPSGSDDWWKSLSVEDKAALMRREEEYAAMGHKPSKRTRETPKKK